MNRGETQERIAWNDPPKRSMTEEIGNAVTHGAGALLGAAGLVLMLLRSETGTKVFTAIGYGTCLIMMFLMSCLYHAFRWGTKVKRLLRRFDYLSIYLLIGGTSAPIWLVFMGGKAGVSGCIAEWVIILAGAVLICICGPDRLRKFHLTLYVILGWCGLIFLPKMVQENLPLFFFMLAGGLLYTFGIIPFALKKEGTHFVWHFFVLFGAIAHWFGIYLYVYG